jgi:hypothetical protein
MIRQCDSNVTSSVEEQQHENCIPQRERVMGYLAEWHKVNFLLPVYPLSLQARKHRELLFITPLDRERQDVLNKQWA